MDLFLKLLEIVVEMLIAAGIGYYFGHRDSREYYQRIIKEKKWKNCHKLEQRRRKNGYSG